MIGHSEVRWWFLPNLLGCFGKWRFFMFFFINKMAAAVILNGIGLTNGVAGVKITPINGVNYTPYS